jgi:hypothetical protein
MFDRLFGRGLEQELTIVPTGEKGDGVILNECLSQGSPIFFYYILNERKYIVSQMRRENHVPDEEITSLFEPIAKLNPYATIRYRIYKNGRKDISFMTEGKENE